MEAKGRAKLIPQLMQVSASMKRFPPTSRKGVESGNRSTLEPNLAEEMITHTKNIKPQAQGVAMSGSLLSE
jgi:hypothetical protein